MTPGLWEKLRGQRLRFIYRRGKPSLLVAENQRARQGQRGGFSAASQKAQTTGRGLVTVPMFRSEEHTSELQSLMRISYAVFCLKQKKFCINDNSLIFCNLT